MIEINTAFTLIRTRTMLHVSLFGFIISACMFLHPFHISNLVPPAFIIALFQLFRSYESGQASGNIFHSFFFTLRLFIITDKKSYRFILTLYSVFVNGETAL